MAITDILLPLTSYPNPTATDAIELAAALARSLGAHVTALAFEMDIRPAIGLYVDPVGVRGILAADRKRSAESARTLLATFAVVADKLGVAHEESLMCFQPGEIPARVAAEARFRDIAIVPLPEDQQNRDIAEALVFESGRPVLVFPESSRRRLPNKIETVAVAWDLSAPSARAVADAIPFLQRAKRVRFFTVVDDKPLKDARLGETLAKHLAWHGIEATMEDIKSGGQSVGQVIESYVDEHKVDLLVMGAYGHSRLREFILGGATERMLAHPPGWVLLSH